MNAALRLFGLLLLVLGPVMGHAEWSFEVIGPPAGWRIATSSLSTVPAVVSPSGSIVASSLQEPDGFPDYAAVWSQGTGWQTASPTLDGYPVRTYSAVIYDDTFLIGNATYQPGFPRGFDPFVWTPEGEMALFESPLGFEVSCQVSDAVPDAQSAIGKVDWPANSCGFIWTKESGYRLLPGYYDSVGMRFRTWSHGLTSDGRTVIGAAERGSSTPIVLWQGGFGPLEIMMPPEALSWYDSRRSLISPDGTYRVVHCNTSIGPTAFWWSDDKGYISLKGLDTGWDTHCEAMSADGGVLVGKTRIDSTYHAFIWTPAKKITKLTSYLDSHGVGSFGSYTEIRPTDVSFDGRTIVGVARNAQSEQVVWIAHIERLASQPDRYDLQEDQPYTANAPGVLQNDTEPDGLTLTAELVDPPTQGTIQLNADGSFTYTPPIGLTGDVTLTYRASNGYEKTQPATVTLHIQPRTVKNLTLDPASVVGGTSSTGYVELSWAAPEGGTWVNLASNDTKATAPSPVFVASGQTTANFLIQTVPVSTSTVATISASLGSSTKTADLTILPPDLLSLVLDKDTLVGGQETTATVTLGSPAPAEGIAVQLSTDKPSLCEVPTDVTVASGQTQASFAVRAKDTDVEGVATITATFNGQSRSAQLTVKPNPSVSGRVFFLDFIGDRPTSCTFEFRNPGTAEVVKTFAASLATNGAYTAVSPGKGVWDMSVKIGHWLRRTRTVDTSNGNVANMSLQLINGDCDGDNAITVFDYNIVSDAFDAMPGDANWNDSADLDGDGSVTVFDYNIVSDNFDMVGDE